MKNTSLTPHWIAGLAAALLYAVSARAGEPLQIPWNQVCRASFGKQLILTTADGGTVTGYCASVTVDELAIRNSQGNVIKIGRQALSRIQMIAPPKHPLHALGADIHRGLQQGFEWLLSPMAPLGLVTLPGTVAWGAVAAPFCVIGEIRTVAGKKLPPREIEVR